ncbi:DNA-directed RNA polymerase III subunit RPC9 [Drosophila nasuta]|uniref:DNA-directed RNA polymerase III subunit RPC9 n=1 Tax=Drosophila albomicans TaxID=7291 RepID=A0A6P8WWY4_DROAB|nr:DNA-directed RNA polymerase III subunit RPC9 [Drosophila albomicans]XP_060662099.1 DNA-directed RNA polymerase III subunit RPC9 [Drosophila nasuta]
METVNETYSYITNMEVMQILLKIKSTKKKFGMRNLATVTYEALQYLEESPCKTQTRESITNYLRDLATYKLKPHEVLQMVNDPPTSALHTQLLIDDNKEPLTDEQNEAIIQLTHKHFQAGNTEQTATTTTAAPTSTTTQPAAVTTTDETAETVETTPVDEAAATQ